MKTTIRRVFPLLSHGISDFLRDGSRAFSLITLWMNGFCALFLYSYWRVIELSKMAPPKEMTAGVVAVVLFYITGDAILSHAYLKASAGGYEQVPGQFTDNSSTTNADKVVAPVTGENPTVNLSNVQPTTED